MDGADRRIGLVGRIVGGQELDMVEPELVPRGLGNDQVAVMDWIECATEETDCWPRALPLLARAISRLNGIVSALYDRIPMR